MESQDKLKVLLEQANITQNNYLENAELSRVVVDDDARIWQFHLKTDRIIPSALYQLMSTSIKEAFKDIAKTELIMAAGEYDEQLVTDYFPLAVNSLTINDNIKHQLERTHKSLKDGVLYIAVKNAIEQSHFNKHINGNLLNAYKYFGIHLNGLEVTIDDDLQSSRSEALETRINDEREALITQFISDREKQEEQMERQGNVPKQIGKPQTFDGVRPLENIFDEEYSVKIEGHIFSKEVRDLKSGRKILQLKLTDYTDSIMAKMFSRHGKNDDEVFDVLEAGDWVIIEGRVEYDEFTKDMVLNIRNLTAINKKPKQDRADKKRVELHLHSTMSQMDGMTSITEYIKRAKQYGHSALAITDHNNVQAFPDAFNAVAGDEDFKMIFGM